MKNTKFILRASSRMEGLGSQRGTRGEESSVSSVSLKPDKNGVGVGICLSFFIPSACLNIS